MLGIQITPRRLRRVRFANARRTRGRPRNRTKYCYDGNGNVATVSRTSGSGPLIYDSTSWWVANLARRISQGGTAAYSDFWYGPGRERIQQTAKKSASVTETTLYVGGAYEKVTRGSTTEHVHYIRGGGYTVAIQKKIVGGTTETRYLHRDHLGSVVAATDYLGAVLERYSFDPWGKRRDPATWVSPAVGTFSFDPAFNDRGYTGHEHIDHLGLVNMNGRVYDPEIGRFLSADPFVQFPESTQGYNRYTYVGNNPLSYTDPSGFFSFKKLLSYVGIALNFIPGLQGWGNTFWEAIMRGFVTGFLAAGGDLKSGVLGAMGGGLFYGVHGLGIGNAFLHSVVKGIIGGGLAALAGAKFKEGFLGAFAGGFLGDKLQGIGGATGSGKTLDLIKRVVRDAVVGGAASALGGGKFKNGAITAAFARMFNDELVERGGKKWRTSGSGNVFVEEGADPATADLGDAQGDVSDKLHAMAKADGDLAAMREHLPGLHRNYIDATLQYENARHELNQILIDLAGPLGAQIAETAATEGYSAPLTSGIGRLLSSIRAGIGRLFSWGDRVWTTYSVGSELVPISKHELVCAAKTGCDLFFTK